MHTCSARHISREVSLSSSHAWEANGKFNTWCAWHCGCSHRIFSLSHCVNDTFIRSPRVVITHQVLSIVGFSTASDLPPKTVSMVYGAWDHSTKKKRCTYPNTNINARTCSNTNMNACTTLYVHHIRPADATRASGIAPRIRILSNPPPGLVLCRVTH